jgi:hypothetical protein
MCLTPAINFPITARNRKLLFFPKNKSNGYIGVTESISQPVDKISAVGKMDPRGLIDKEDKGWGCSVSLRSVEELHFSILVKRGFMI